MHVGYTQLHSFIIHDYTFDVAKVLPSKLSDLAKPIECMLDDQ